MAVKKQQPMKARAAAPRSERAGNLNKLIEEAAYYRAQRRGFAPGHELDDWIAAEAEVRRRMEH